MILRTTHQATSATSIKTILAALFALTVILSGVQMAQATDGESLRLITLTGNGSVSAEPDRVSISLGVTTSAQSAQLALRDNASQMRAIIAALKDEDISERNIQTQNFSVQPVYERNNNQGDAPRVSGYQVNNQVRILVEGVSRLGPVLDTVIELGSNQIHGIEFGVSEAEELRDDARELAVKDARRKAEIYARAAGVRLGAVRHISESGGHSAPRMSVRAMAAEAAPPIEGGQLSIDAQVTISWEIE